MCPPHSDIAGDVAPACDVSAMTMPYLRGIELRYVLTFHLSNQGPATVVELIDALHHHGFGVKGRPSKAISDAFRWEIERGRVRRLGRGRYGPAYIPRATDDRIHRGVLALRSAVVAMRRAESAPLPGVCTRGGCD
jgi:hypothetical protein